MKPRLTPHAGGAAIDPRRRARRLIRAAPGPRSTRRQPKDDMCRDALRFKHGWSCWRPVGGAGRRSRWQSSVGLTCTAARSSTTGSTPQRPAPARPARPGHREHLRAWLEQFAGQPAAAPGWSAAAACLRPPTSRSGSRYGCWITWSRAGAAASRAGPACPPPGGLPGAGRPVRHRPRHRGGDLGGAGRCGSLHRLQVAVRHPAWTSPSTPPTASAAPAILPARARRCDAGRCSRRPSTPPAPAFRPRRLHQAKQRLGGNRATLAAARKLARRCYHTLGALGEQADAPPSKAHSLGGGLARCGPCAPCPPR